MAESIFRLVTCLVSGVTFHYYAGAPGRRIGKPSAAWQDLESFKMSFASIGFRQVSLDR